MANIIVTGVGGGVGQSIIKSLQSTSYNLFAVDAELLATGLYAVPKAYTVSYASDPRYIERLLDICNIENCSLIFPGLDAELPVLSRHSDKFKASGKVPIVSCPEVIDICDDKLVTSQFLTQHGFNAPLTLQLTDDSIPDMPFPIVLKPRRGGARSRGVFIVKDKAHLSFLSSRLDVNNYVAQEYLEGDEYTCGTINFDGTCYGTIVMRRILRDGDTYKAFVVSDPDIHAYVKAVAEALKPFGPCNFQLRLVNRLPYIFEINPRCSGTTYSRALAGFNEPLMVADYLTQGKIPTYVTRNIAILRYWKELVVENSHIETIQRFGKLIGNGSKL